MRPVRTLLVLFALICIIGYAFAPKTSLAENKRQISEVTLERSGGMVFRSGYKVVLRKDGRAEYIGETYAKREGKYRGHISKEQFERLAEVIVENDYFSLDDKYHAEVTDSDTITTSVVFSGGRKRVEDFGRGGGERLTNIEREIDKVAEQIVWVRDKG
jgi:hypothetical protein